MNNKGQSLTMFIIILPIALILLGVMIESSLIAYNKNRLISVTKTIIANSIERNKKNDIILLYDKNDIDIENINIEDNNGIKISVTSNVDSFLGDIIGKDKYKIHVDIHGFKKGNKIYYEKG